jgi:hypothetical protein
MTYVKTEKFAPRASLHGDRIGLYDDGENDFTVGRNLRGTRVSGLATQSGTFPNIISVSTPGLVLGAGYILDSYIRHVEMFDDFLGKALATGTNGWWNANLGSDGSCAAAVHADQSCGTCRLTTGAGSTHTVAVNGAEITGDKNWLVSNGGLVFEARIGKLSAATSQSIFFGLADSDALSAPFTLATATVTANATNGVGFLQDAAGTNTALNLVSVNAGGSPQVAALATGVSTTAYNIFRVEVGADGSANFFIDYTQVGSLSLAVATTAQLCPVIEMFSEATSASQTIDIDYVFTQGMRA